jgi:hypothetical protein
MLLQRCRPDLHEFGIEAIGVAPIFSFLSWAMAGDIMMAVVAARAISSFFICHSPPLRFRQPSWRTVQ